MGRHSAADDDEDVTPTEVLDLVPEPPARPVSSGRADLHLLKTAPGVRARCAAAIVVPFLLYTIAMVLISRTEVYLLWLWIPTVVAGILVGHMLDRAHNSSAPPL